MRLGRIKLKNFVFRLSLLLPFAIFAKTITYHREAMSKIYPVGIQSFEAASARVCLSLRWKLIFWERRNSSRDWLWKN